MFNTPGMDPISSHNAGLFMNGKHQTNCKSFSLEADVVTKANRVLGQQSERSRVRGINYSGTLTFYKRTTWLYDYVKEIQDNQYMAPFTLQGVLDDPGSDFGREQGIQIVRLVNCVPDGKIVLMAADNECNDVEETINIKGERIA